MKKRMFPLLITAMLLVSCGGNASATFYDKYQDPILGSEDNYRTYYEIFPRSFADSNGDYYGDLIGIKNKLDYIENLGFNGIWLTPINDSPSYHGYDVTDYKKINPLYGTMEDYKALIDECHSRDIKIILDLVLNHTSINHPWFTNGVEAFKKGTGEKYSDYYNFSLTRDDIHSHYSAGVYYEGGFGSHMPDLNLDSENVRNEIKDIIKFYIEMGVDGFRLDATTWFYFGNNDKNIEFLSFVNSYAKSINPDTYIVGEAWTSPGEISQLYQSNIDSFFTYTPNPYGTSLLEYMNMENPKDYINGLIKYRDQSPTKNPGFFITNHDNPRAVNMLASKSNVNRIKLGFGLLQLSSGTTFTYYGDEIGMTGKNPPDENVRTAMYWSDNVKELTNDPSGSSVEEKVYPSVQKQVEDEESLLWYVRDINRIRNKYPSIRKGNIENLTESSPVGLMKKTFENETVYIAINFNKTNSEELDLSGLNLSKINYEEINISNKKASLKNKKITIPSYGIVIIKG